MKFKLSGIFVLITIVLLWSSCQDATAPDMNPSIASPSNVEMSISGSTVKTSWEFSAEKPIDYLIAELATDDDFQNIIERDTLQPDVKEVSFEEAAVSLQYYFRIRAVTPNRATSSQYATQKLELPNVMQPVRDSDIGGSSAVVNWEQPEEGEVTRIELTSETGSSSTVELTQEEINNRSITLENLMEGTEYTAVMYAGDLRVGLVTFTTVDTSAIITINDQEELYKSLHRAVDNAVAGDTIHVKGEHDFTEGGAVRVDKPLIIEGVEDPGNPSIITFVGFELTGEVSELSVSGLEMRGAGSYTFSLDAGSHVIVKDSEVSGFTAGLYKAGTGNYAFTMGNSLIHDFGNSENADKGLFELTGGEPVHFEITNSTFWNLTGKFIYASTEVVYQDYENNYPIIDQCTINNVSENEFTHIRSGNTFKLRMWHSILTNKKSDVKNIMWVEAFANHNNVYGSNSDRFFEYWWGWKNQGREYSINEMNQDPMYADPANGDFTVGNQTLIDSTFGDPRWLPSE
ncbi:fibronectin type III domain-containing protein [Aliifodinibius sp. S!AR15-10]|uniref:DUF5123 domain-containing protein n=1 Tax=Aliifodinibius sp. S!AR15-10 TaxID=2950437 RepID=UPI002855EDEA|nr:DUF5123 domain-containing protein [Aliifodinibius sp. S!AR15-10]MDR8391924.1 fibronectin type III domain-containing protein [Aliifodinibius sp. S!AR15-10]